MYQRELNSKSDSHAAELEREQILTIGIRRENTSNEDPEVPTELSER